VDEPRSLCDFYVILHSQFGHDKNGYGEVVQIRRNKEVKILKSLYGLYSTGSNLVQGAPYTISKLMTSGRFFRCKIVSVL
jgi:hypothetical protein